LHGPNQKLLNREILNHPSLQWLMFPGWREGYPDQERGVDQSRLVNTGHCR
jgi:hypothetical protein